MRASTFSSTCPDNLSSWERYETSRDGLDKQLQDAVTEFKATRRIYDLSANAGDYATRTETAKNMRKDAEDTFKALTESSEILSKLAQNVKKKELADEVIERD